MANTVKDIMRDVNTINVNKTFFDALSTMIEKRTNSLLVVSDEGKLVGMLNAGILIEKVVPAYLEKDAIAAHFANEEIFTEEVEKIKDTPIADFIVTDIKKINLNASLMEVAIMAISAKQMRIPVIDADEKPVGTVTRTELKKVLGKILKIKNI